MKFHFPIFQSLLICLCGSVVATCGFLLLHPGCLLAGRNPLRHLRALGCDIALGQHLAVVPAGGGQPSGQQQAGQQLPIPQQQ
ncbi:hypothetical protein VI26_18185 [Chromobacterium sp. LK1]|nr:hypothetical protein VI26_18185 [Chromobacterium sp. LK1]